MAEPRLAVGRRPQGDKPLTLAERSVRLRQRKAMTISAWRQALEQIRTVKTAREAREIAEAALKTKS